MCAALTAHQQGWLEKHLVFDHRAALATLEYGRVLKGYETPASGAFGKSLVSGVRLLSLATPGEASSTAEEPMAVDDEDAPPSSAPAPEVAKSKSKKKKEAAAAKKQREEEEKVKEAEVEKPKAPVRLFSSFRFSLFLILCLPLSRLLSLLLVLLLEVPRGLLSTPELIVTRSLVNVLGFSTNRLAVVLRPTVASRLKGVFVALSLIPLSSTFVSAFRSLSSPFLISFFLG